jgi:hypothetical protein
VSEISSVNDVDYRSQMPSMWADTLQSAERDHLLRLLLWGATNIIAGTAMLAWLRVSARESALLRHFAVQCAAWGLIISTVGGLLLTQLQPRDLSGATRLDRFLWLNIGLDFGFVLTGLTLLAVGWRMGRRLELAGAGVGIVVQGLALSLLDLVFAAQISR